MSTAVPLAAATVKALEGDWQYVDKKVECGVGVYLTMFRIVDIYRVSHK